MPNPTRKVYVVVIESRVEHSYLWYPDTTSADVLMSHYGKAIEEVWTNIPPRMTIVRLVECKVPANRTGARVTEYLEAACQWSMTRGPALIKSTIHADLATV